MIKEESLSHLLKDKIISQRTYDKVTVAKNYIERKYNLKDLKAQEWKAILQKIESLDISVQEKNKIKKHLLENEAKNFRRKRIKLTIRDYESLSIIGRGAFGEVHVCREKRTGHIVAIKKIRKSVLEEKNQILHTRNEQQFMSNVKSPWFAELKASFQEDDFLYLVMEFLQGGDLMNLLIKKDTLSESEARFYLAEMILAIEEIHKLDCIHRDIKPDNILIGKDGHIKLVDFGLAKISDKIFEDQRELKSRNESEIYTHQKQTFSCVGTAYYVAPEVLIKKGYGKEIDWWSLGTIFYEMLIGYAPFCSKDTSEVCAKVLNWQKYLKIPKKSKLSNEASDLIYKLITNVKNRLGKNGAGEIKRHPFFKDVDWENIRNTKAPFIPSVKNDYDVSYFDTFEVKDPFYPPVVKNKKRKDANYLGYTYRKDDDSMNNSFDKEDLFERVYNNLRHSKSTNENNTSDNSKYWTFQNEEHFNERKREIEESKKEIEKDNQIKQKDKMYAFPLPLKKIKIDCSQKSLSSSRKNKNDDGNNLKISPESKKMNIFQISNPQPSKKISQNKNIIISKSRKNI